jgi:hypothetical protein
MDQHPTAPLATMVGGTGNRRASLKALALGFAALGAAPLAGSARNKHKHNSKKSPGTKKCQQQVAPCITELQGRCNPGDATCLAAINDCCAFLGTCDAARAVQCIVGKSAV